jgi:hypothetical protein
VKNVTSELKNEEEEKHHHSSQSAVPKLLKPCMSACCMTEMTEILQVVGHLNGGSAKNYAAHLRLEVKSSSLRNANKNMVITS